MLLVKCSFHYLEACTGDTMLTLDLSLEIKLCLCLKMKTIVSEGLVPG